MGIILICDDLPKPHIAKSNEIREKSPSVGKEFHAKESFLS